MRGVRGAQTYETGERHEHPRRELLAESLLGPLEHGHSPSHSPTYRSAQLSNEKPTPSAAPSSCQVPTQEGDGATAWLCEDACLGKCPAPGGGLYVKFYPSDFPFVTVIKDDGKDPGGGWQEAKVNLMFTRAVIPWSVVTWWCPFNIGMPFRAEIMGKISPSRAADLSVEITESVGRGMDFSEPPGIFCSRFMGRVEKAFEDVYPKLGAKVRKW